MVNNIARARAREKAGRQWLSDPTQRHPASISLLDAFVAGAAWEADALTSPESDAEVNQIVASLIREAQAAGGDDAADHEAKRVAAYFAAIHGAEQDDWAIERATGQRQLDEAAVLIREAAALLRGYEAHHRDLAAEARDAGDFSNGDRRDEKAERNAEMAARLEAWLAGDNPAPGAMSPAQIAEQEAFVSAALEAGIDQIGESDEPPADFSLEDRAARAARRAGLWACRQSGQIEDDQWEAHLRDDPALALYEPIGSGGAAPPIIATTEPRPAGIGTYQNAREALAADLIAAIAGAVLIEECGTWLKVHGLPDARPLFDVLTAAKAASENQSVRDEQAARLRALIGREITKSGGDYQFQGEDRKSVV